MSRYPTGNKTVLQMIDSGTFDAALAEVLLNGVDLNAPICDLSGYSTTYLYEAVSNNNLQAVAFLLEHGADPNLNIPELIGDCALWQLQFLDIGQDWQTRYEISKLFFQYGANPNIKCDRESLYDDVVWFISFISRNSNKVKINSMKIIAAAITNPLNLSPSIRETKGTPMEKTM